MGVIHEIFPLVVYQGEVDGHDKFKKKYLNELKDYWFNGYDGLVTNMASSLHEINLGRDV